MTTRQESVRRRLERLEKAVFTQQVLLEALQETLQRPERDALLAAVKKRVKEATCKTSS